MDEAVEPAPGAPPTTTGRHPALTIIAAVLVGCSVIALVLVGIRSGGRARAPLTLPPRVDGIIVESGPADQAEARALRGVLIASLPLQATVAAVYVDVSGAPRSVVIAAGTGAVKSPPAALDKVLGVAAAGIGGSAVTTDVASGPLGGVTRCRFAAREGTSTTAICGWADHRSVGLAEFPNRPVPQAAALLRALRRALRGLPDAGVSNDPKDAFGPSLSDRRCEPAAVRQQSA